MANYRLRHTYGHGAAKLPLAPVFAQSPFSRPETLADSTDEALRQLRDAGPGRLAVRFAAIVGSTAAAALAFSILLAPLFEPPDDDPTQELVLVVNEPLDEEELVPEPPPVAPEPEPVLPEPEPEPEQVAVEPEPPPPVAPEPPPEPVKIVKRAPPPLPAMPKAIEPPPAEEIPTAAPVRVARAPVKRPPAVVSIDPLSPVPLAPSADPAPAPPPTRTAARPPKASRPALPALADFAPIGDATAAPGEAAAVASRTVRTNVVARAGAPSRPIAFAAVAPAAPPAAYDEDGETPALATRRAVPQKRAAATSSGPSARPLNMGFAAAATTGAAVKDSASKAGTRSERAAVSARASSAAPDENLAAVPLGSLAACASDREEDERKLDLLAAVKGRTECTSRAGRYRFVETKNLNAFLMWIERAPKRPAVDRCVELRLALECLGG